jgi:type I restriction enzyme S subunit
MSKATARSGIFSNGSFPVSSRPLVKIADLAAPTSYALATGPFGSSIGTKTFRTSGVPIIRGSNLSADVGTRLIDADLVFIDPELAEQFKRSQVTDGDLVFTCWGTINQVGLIDRSARHRRYVISNKQMKLTVDPRKASPLFLYYWFSGPDGQAQILGGGIGSSVPGFNLGQLRGMRVPMPALDQQRAIASILGALDDKIDLNRRMNETLEAMARAIFRDWFVIFGPTRAKQEGRPPYLAPDLWSLFPNRLDDDGKPEGWLARPVRDFAELRGGKQLEKKRISTTGTIPVFGGAGIMGFTGEHNADGFVISVGRVGAYCGQFFSHRGKAWINNNASLIRQFEEVSGEWLFQSLRHADIEVIKKGAAQPFVSNSDVGNMPIIWPGENVVRRFTDIVVPLMVKMEQNKVEASTLADTRDLLLPKLMSGELRVKDTERLAEAAL